MGRVTSTVPWTLVRTLTRTDQDLYIVQDPHLNRRKEERHITLSKLLGKGDHKPRGKQAATQRHVYTQQPRDEDVGPIGVSPAAR